MPETPVQTSARRPRVWCPGPWPANGRIILPPEATHHLTRVLRMKDGEPIELFDGQGRRAPSRLDLQSSAMATVQLEDQGIQTPPPPLQIRLAQALAKGDKMDWIIEKAVELGVSAIQPLQGRRSVVELHGQRLAQRVAHWQRVVVAAATQCGQDHLPLMSPPQPAGHWFEDPGELGAPALRLLLDPLGTHNLESVVGDAMPDRIDLAIGPESGWDPGEIEIAVRRGWRLLRVGPRVLRTETAGLAVLAALQSRWGDWR
ncbi:MAG: 16S rRNA (uracil(1498)-N(3))-methyltransferase [Burkholderiaceae bacterium]